MINLIIMSIYLGKRCSDSEPNMMRTFIAITLFSSVAFAATINIQMPGAQPMHSDEYLCSAFSIKNLTGATGRTKHYITGFNVTADSTKVGHVGIIRCNNASIEEGEVYSCLNPDDICGSSYSWYKVIYDWGKDAGPFSLPADVGFEVDGEEDHIVMQVHYKVPLDFKDNTSAVIKYTDDKPQYSAGMMILIQNNLTIPRGVGNVQADMKCKVCHMTLYSISLSINPAGAPQYMDTFNTFTLGAR